MRNIFLILFLLMAGGFIQKSSAQAVILKADTLEVPCISTDTFLVPVRLDNFTNISGLQFTLQWDTARLDYAFVTMLHPQFSGVGFDTSAATIALGKLTFAWTDLAGLSLPSNTVLFEVAFRRIGGPPAPIAFVDDPTAVAVFDNQFNEVAHQTINGLVKPIDDIGPTITCPANVVTGWSGPVPILNIAPTLDDNCGTPAAGWSSTGATFANFPNDPDASGALFNIGLSTVTYKATDAGGNTATCSFDILVEFSVSTTDLTLIANPNNLASCGETVTIDVLAFNFDSIAGLQYSMSWLPANLEFVSITNTNAALNIGLSNFNLDSTGVGFFTFAWTSADLNGASVPSGDLLFTLTYNVLGSGTVDFVDLPTETLAFIGPSFDETTLITFGATVSVIDTFPPAITCPADITVQAPSTTPVQGIAPANVTDNCAAPLIGWSVTGDTNGSFPNDADASGGLFNIGTSTVTYLATDAGNNTASCSFNVTVEFANNTTDLTIIANSTNAACGGTFGVDFSALNFNTVAGVQFTVHWDPALYQYTSVSDFNLPIGIGLSNFGIDSVGVGFITFAWTSGDLNGVSVNDTEVLFRLNFNLLNNTSSGILFGDDPTIRVAFDGGTFAEIPMVTIDGLVNVADNVPPTITCPTPPLINAPQGQLFATVNGLEPTTLTDNCAGVPTLSYTQSGVTTNSGNGNANGDYNAGTTTVVYTATDANGNTATCSFQVVVDAGTPVILQLDTVDLGCQGIPAQVTVNLTVKNFIDIIGLQFGLNWDPLVLQLVTPVPIHYITAGPPPLFINQGNGTLAFFGGHPAWPDVPNDSAILTLTFNVLDVNGLATTNLFFVGPYDVLNGNFQAVPIQTVNGAFLFSLDNVPPVVTCPTDTVLNAPALTCDVNFTPPPPTATDACGAVASITFTPALNVFPAGPTAVTYTVTDDAGNSSTCVFNVNVMVNNPPQVSGCPIGPILVDANGLCQGNATWTPPTFQDICGQALDTIINDYDPGGLFSFGTTLVNYTATDLSGNVTTCSFEVVVRDVTSPTLICPADTVITPVNGCSAVVNYTIVATDACDPDLTFICSDTSGALFTGVTPVLCAVVDDAGNVSNCAFSVTILDTAPPAFINGCPANINVVSASGNCGANPSWQTPVVMDSCDQSVTLMPSQASGTFFDVANSPHTVTYTATDDQGNTATCLFTVTVADSTKPILNNCPTLPIVKVLPIDSCTVTLSWTPPTATDNCGAGLLTLTSNLNPGPFPTGDTMVVYTATDGSGNITTCSFKISVKDVVPPSFIDCPTQALVIPNGDPCGNPVNFTFPTGTDNCTPANELVYTSSFMPNDTFIIGTTQFPVRVTDASGNFVECFITITVMGQVATFINIPATIMVTGCDTHVTWTSPIPVGFCPPITIDSSHQSGIIFPFGTTTVTYTATDTYNNIATATFNVVVTEDIAPVFDCPVSPVIVNVGGVIVSDPSNFLTSVIKTDDCDGVILDFNLPSATDNCVTPTVTLLQGLASGSVFPIGFNNLVFRAVDSSGNLSQCAVFIEVAGLPELAPIVNPNPGCAGDTITITAADIAGATYTWTGPVTSTTNVLTINSLSQQNDGDYIVTANVNGCSVGPDTATVFLPLQPMAENDLNYSIDPNATETFSSVLENDNLSPAFDFEICDTTSFLEGLVMNFSDGTFTYTAGEAPGMVSFVYQVCSKTCNLQDQAVVTITIKDTKCAFIPNIITPNGDPINEYFVIPCIDTRLFNENSLSVYNQWGDLIFEASPYNNDWNGTLNNEPGKNLPDGVYFYIFKPGPNAPTMKGFVEVFR